MADGLLPHKLSLNERKALNITGVSEVLRFDDTSVVLRTSMGTLMVHGSQLQLKTLSLDGGQIAGVVVLNHEAIDAYATAAWAVEASASEALVVHALGVVPDYLGQGVARFLLDSALEVAREAGCLAVRLDVYVENTPALRLYRSYGFRDLGCHTVDYGDIDLNQFHLFEYVL